MAKLKMLLFILLFAFGCEYSGSQKNTATKLVSTDQLISANKNRLLFLNFWGGMSEQEFNQIMKFENEKGNLKNDKFLLMISPSHSIPFEIHAYENSISLSYSDSQWATYTGNSFYALNEIPSGKSYSYIENELINLFNNKYEEIEIPEGKDEISERLKSQGIDIDLSKNEIEHDIVRHWKTTNEKKNRIITLNSSYSFLDKNFDPKTSVSGASSKFYHDRENKKAKIGECSIHITYEFLDEYTQRQKEQKILEQKQKEIREQKWEEKNNKIKENNSNL